jgi:hypothetical protein
MTRCCLVTWTILQGTQQGTSTRQGTWQQTLSTRTLFTCISFLLEKKTTMLRSVEVTTFWFCTYEIDPQFASVEVVRSGGTLLPTLESISEMVNKMCGRDKRTSITRQRRTHQPTHHNTPAHQHTTHYRYHTKTPHQHTNTPTSTHQHTNTPTHHQHTNKQHTQHDNTYQTRHANTPDTSREEYSKHIARWAHRRTKHSQWTTHRLTIRKKILLRGVVLPSWPGISGIRTWYWLENGAQNSGCPQTSLRPENPWTNNRISGLFAPAS